MTENFNELSPAQTERLAILAEECGEVIQAVGKILRHGWDSRENRENLEKELGDVWCIVQMLSDSQDIWSGNVEQYAVEKRHRIKQYTHHL